jgi:hypothetical protein
MVRHIPRSSVNGLQFFQREGEEYGDEPTNEKSYNGDPEWFRDF